jgi:hypothetical protein
MWGNFLKEVPPRPFKNLNEKEKMLAVWSDRTAGVLWFCGAGQKFPCAFFFIATVFRTIHRKRASLAACPLML